MRVSDHYCKETADHSHFKNDITAKLFLISLSILSEKKCGWPWHHFPRHNATEKQHGDPCES